MFDKGIQSYECKRDLIISREECALKKCQAEYGPDTDYTECKPDCIKQLDQSKILKKTRTRHCKSDDTKCNEGGKEEIRFCENQSLCELQRRNPATGLLVGKYTHSLHILLYLLKHLHI